MELLIEISDKDLGIPYNTGLNISDFDEREAARAVMFKDDKIALIYVSKNKYHKLPGGGIEEDENIQMALEREILEETGCEIEVISEIGKSIENKYQQKKHQISFCFIAKVKSIVSNPSFTEKEKSDGFELMWVTLGEAIKLLENDSPLDYMGNFIRQRDLTFLKKCKEIP